MFTKFHQLLQQQRTERHQRSSSPGDDLPSERSAGRLRLADECRRRSECRGLNKNDRYMWRSSINSWGASIFVVYKPRIHFGVGFSRLNRGRKGYHDYGKLHLTKFGTAHDGTFGNHHGTYRGPRPRIGPKMEIEMIEELRSRAR